MSKGCVHAVIHLILSVAMETVTLKQCFIHCRLTFFTCTSSFLQNRNQLTANNRCCDSLISEFIKFLHTWRPIIYPTHIHIYTILIENLKYKPINALTVLHTQTNPQTYQVPRFMLTILFPWQHNSRVFENLLNVGVFCC